jgi:hypothetical protein
VTGPAPSLRPWLITADPSLAAAGRATPGLDVHDAFSAARPNVVRRLLALDHHLHAHDRRALPAWVLYDCALAPGAVVGFAAPREALTPEAVARFGVGDAELFPVSFAMVIPTAAPAASLMHSLAAAPDLLGDPSFAGSLLDATRALAESTLGLDTYLATAPWASPLPGRFAAHRPCRVLAALCPTHDEPATAVLTVGEPVDPEAHPAPFDLGTGEGLEALQRALEAGHKAWIACDAPSGALRVLLTVEADR